MGEAGQHLGAVAELLVGELMGPGSLANEGAEPEITVERMVT